uniref:Uncharacterized protein n=1 Tax=Anopheles stephensi TaxID=30069 RepID=A0A182YDG4_ANOST
MYVTDNLHVLLRSLRVLGLLSIQQNARNSRSTSSSFESTYYAALKFVILFGAALLGCGYSSFLSIKDNSLKVLESPGTTIWPFVYVVNNFTLCGRKRLAAALNNLHQNEMYLVDVTGKATNYRTVRLLAIVTICKGFMAHIFYQTLYINVYYRPDRSFIPIYIYNCMFMYVDVAMELVFGLCDCLLLMVRLQLERLVRIAKDLSAGGIPADRLLRLYVAVYCKIRAVLSHNLGPYFGLLIVLHCSYVCLEVAICILDLYQLIVSKATFGSIVLGYIIWPLIDVQKLLVLFLLGEGVKTMVIKHGDENVVPSYKSVHNATLKLVLFFGASILGSGYLLLVSILHYNAFSATEGNIWLFVYVVHNATFGIVFCALPWQTFRQRNRLAAAMNALHENELCLIKLTGVVTNYRSVKMLVGLVVFNGVIFHVFFHSYFIKQHYWGDKPFLPVYVSSCIYMYVDLAIELVLGLCDCLLLIVRLQLERLMWIAKNLDSVARTDRLFQFYVAIYSKTIVILRDNLSPYFGLIILMHCSYVCLEVAVCLLDAYSYATERSFLSVVANILWPVSDVKKLTVLFLLGEGVNAMVSMHVCDNLRVLFRCLRLIGLFSVQKHIDTNLVPSYRSVQNGTLKLVLFFGASLLGSGYLLYRSIKEYDAYARIEGNIWPFVFIIHNVSYGIVFCVLPWQTFRQRDRLAAAMNALHENELSLSKLTGVVTNYRLVKMLMCLVVFNAVIFHAFFHLYFIQQHYWGDKPFLPVYVSSCIYMYVDLAIELVLGLCDCLLLIVRLQLERLMWIAKNLDAVTRTDRLFQFYVAIYSKTIVILRDYLSPYFGLIVLMHCSYVCLEVAICILDAMSYITEQHHIMPILANILWPLSDMKKLMAVFLLGEGVNAMQKSGNHSFESIPYAVHKFVIFFTITLLGSGYSMYRNVIDYPAMVAIGNRTILPFFYIAHTITFCAVFCILPWQTVLQRRQLAILINTLNRNEEDLIGLTGHKSNSRIVSLLAAVCCTNGVILHLFFHFYYIDEFLGVGRDMFMSLYMVSCLFLYTDLAMEYVLGLCDCLLLIAQLQLERLMWLVRDLKQGTTADRDRVFRLYLALYSRTVHALRRSLSRYFGPLLAVFCTYVSLEVAICVLAIVGDTTSFLGHSNGFILANVLWPISDLKKLAAVFVLSERTNSMWLQTVVYNMSAIGLALVRYDGRRQTYGRLSGFRSALQILNALFCVCVAIVGVYEDFDITVLQDYVLAEALFLVTTASFCVIWLVVPVYVYMRCARLVCALNSLLANDAELRRATATMRMSDSLSYQQAKRFARMIQCDGMLCCLLLTSGYVAYFSLNPEAWYFYLPIIVYIYEDLCLSCLFGFYSTVLLLSVAQLSCAANLLQTHLMQERTGRVEERVHCFCAIYDRICTLIAQPIYEYCGPIIVAFCPLVIFEGSLKLFHLQDIDAMDEYGPLWLNVIEWIWLCFDCKKLVVLLYVSEVFKQKYMRRLGIVMVKYDPKNQTFNSAQYGQLKFAICFTVALLSSCYLLWRSPKDYIVYKLDSKMFDISIFIINTVVSCIVCLIVPVQCYCRHMALAGSLNALLSNECALRRAFVLVAGVSPPCYRHATLLSHIVLWDGLACFSFFYCCYVVTCWKNDTFVHIHLSICIYLLLDISLEWTFGLCCVVMLVGAQQLASIDELLLKASSERTVAFEQILIHFCNVYGRVSIDVRKGLSVYYGPLVVSFTSMLVLQCAVKMVDIWGAVNDGTGDLPILALGCLWLLFDVKKFVSLMLVSEYLTPRTLGVCYVKYCSSASAKFIIPEQVTLKFCLSIVGIVAGGCYTLLRTKQDVQDRSEKDSFFDFVTNFASNVMLVLALLQMSICGYYQKQVHVDLLNSMVDIERKLSVLIRTRRVGGGVARLTKWLTLWSTIFYVIVMHIAYIVNEYQYETFVMMYIETLLLLYANGCIDFIIIICCTTQIQLWSFLHEIAQALGANECHCRRDCAALCSCMQLIDRIIALISVNLSKVYGSFVVIHSFYVLYESATIWLAFLMENMNMGFRIVNEEKTLSLVIYLLWIVSDMKNVMLLAISSSLLQQKMSALLKRYRSLLAVAALGYIVPCHYNVRTRSFECSHRNSVACVCIGVFFGFFVWYDYLMVLKFNTTLPTVLVGIIAIDVTVYNLLIYCIILNGAYHRKWFVQLLNDLFAYDDWMLEWIAIRGAKDGIDRPMHSGSLGRLIGLVVLYCLYNILFVDDYATILMDLIILLRYCFMFLFLELYRACALIIKERMNQLKVLLTLGKPDDLAIVEHTVDMFLERFERYYQLIDDVNKCFCLPLTHILLLIVLERTVAAYDAFVNSIPASNMEIRYFYGFLYRQIWEVTYIAMLVQLAVTCDATSAQNRFMFRIMTTIYFLPATYNHHEHSFIEQRFNRVSFGIGLLMSIGYFYHDFYIQNVFLDDLPPFSFAIVLVELALFASVPLFIVLNSFYHRKRMTQLLNVLFNDDQLLDSTSIRMDRAYHLYMTVVIVLILLFEVVTLGSAENLPHKMLATTYVIRFACVLQFVYLIHLCVGMVGLRMQQLKLVFDRTQREEDFEYILEQFITRFERYVVLIDEINRCFSFPIVTVFTLGMVELSYFAFECFHTMSAGVPDRDMYDGFHDWIFSQFWQALYSNFLLPVVLSCESTQQKRYRTLFILANVMYLLPCSYNYRTRTFETYWYHTVALVVNITFYSLGLWLDIVAIEFSIGHMSLVMFGIILIYIITYALMLFVFAINMLYHRETCIQLFNTLFGQDDWILEWAAIKRTTNTAIVRSSATHHSGSLIALALLVVSNWFYIFFFIQEGTIFKLYGLILLRFCSMFLLVELYRACVITIRERMMQLQTFITLVQSDSNIQIFLERFQRYHQLIDSVNQCFAIPLTSVLLLILLERTVSAYDLYDNFGRIYDMTPWNLFGFLFRQLWQAIYPVIVLMICITSHLTSMQTLKDHNRITFRILSMIYFLPAAYDTVENCFVKRWSSFVSFGVGLLISLGYIYHDLLFVLLNYSPSVSAFSFAVFVIELLVFCLVPFCTVCNCFIHRKQIVKLLNVLFVDDNALEVGRDTVKNTQLSSLFSNYMKVLYVVIALLSSYNFTTMNNTAHALLEITLLSRFILTSQFLYHYHLCVNMVQLRMKQLKAFFLQNQCDPDFEQLFRLFTERFYRYAGQIDRINQCLSGPLLGMLLQVMIELAYFSYECFRVLSTRQVVDVNYGNVSDWIITQFWQSTYGNFLLLIVPSCELAMNEHERVFEIASLLYFTPCSYNEQRGLFVATKRNTVVFGVVLTVTIPFWVYDVRLMVTNFLSTYTTVFAAVGGIELLIYASVMLCATLNVFIKRKRITKLMNVLFLPDRILDRYSPTTKNHDRYNDNGKLGTFSVIIVIMFCFKFSYHSTIETKILTIMIVSRFLAIWVLIFIYRFHARAIEQRMEQLRVLCASEEFQHNISHFLDRYDRYTEQIAEVDHCYSLPVVLIFLLVMVQLLYLAENWYTILETRTPMPITNSIFNSMLSQLWQTFYGVLGFYAISACADTSREVEETALCTRHFDDYRLQNTRAAKQIQKFLLKNLHQKKKFSACGFFDIDNTVIYMVFSSIVTYLVILIQFKQLETDLTQSQGNYNVSMSSYYRRHARIFQVAALLYLVPCSYNRETDQFEEQVSNKLAFAFGIMMTVPFWYVDVKFMTEFYLENISPIMTAVGSIEIALFVSIVACTILNTFGRRNRYTRMLNVLFHADWLLDRYEHPEKDFDNRRPFGGFMIALSTMVCCNMLYHRDIKIRLLSLSVSMKIFGVCYLTILYRICVGAIGVRMAQLRALYQLNQVRHTQEQTVRYFIERFDLYAAQLRQIDYCFSFPLTMIILLVLIEMVYLMFDLFTILELGRPAYMENLEIDYLQWTLRQMWQTIYGAVVLLTVTGCQSTCEQLQQTAQLVKHFDDDRNRNSRVAKLIQRFLLQNLDRKTSFSACGMFHIDYAMLHMLFSSIFTYMVILIQFDQLQPERLSYTN